MSVTSLRKWDVSAIEIALDVAPPRLVDSNAIAYSGPAQPRICLVAAFALTSQLKHIVAAVDRAAPARPPSAMQLAPSVPRTVIESESYAVSVRPIRPLLVLQSKIVRAIEPGLALEGPVVSAIAAWKMDWAAANFIRDFIPSKALPAFEPSHASSYFDAVDIRATGLTIYRLGNSGQPEQIVAHWLYPHDKTEGHLRVTP